MLAGMGSILEVNHLRVARGHTTILHDVSWRVARGEHWVILGANGSGKTSMLKALTGFLSPTAGEFSVLGRQYGRSDWRELRLQIGVVTSAFAMSIPPSEVARDTVVSGKYAQLDLWHAGTRADRAAAERLLRAGGLGALAKREWAYLSQGERQRVLIARALAGQPRILLLDEATSALDAESERLVQQAFATLMRDHTTLIIAHRLATVQHADRIVVLEHGRIVEVGTHAALSQAGGLYAKLAALQFAS